MSWGIPFNTDLYTDTHRCIGGVFYCARCDRLYIPPLVVEADPDGRPCGQFEAPLFIFMAQEFACWKCHEGVCGGWLAALLSTLHP